MLRSDSTSKIERRDEEADEFMHRAISIREFERIMDFLELELDDVRKKKPMEKDGDD